MRKTFSHTEHTLLDEKSKLEMQIFTVSLLSNFECFNRQMQSTIGELMKSVALAENNQERAANEFKQIMEMACNRRKEETKMLEDEIWNLKANVKKHSQTDGTVL